MPAHVVKGTDRAFIIRKDDVFATDLGGQHIAVIGELAKLSDCNPRAAEDAILL